MHMHGGITWPVRGYYQCKTCHRTFAVPWEEPVYHSIAMPAKKQLRPEVHQPRSVAA
jgi:transposase-like protein